MALNKQRREEMAQELQEYNKMFLHEANRSHMEEKNRFRNLSRYLNAQRQEIENDVNSIEQVKKGAIRDRQNEEEEKLAVAVDQLRRKEIAEQKLRQHLRENSQELRELESKLRAAYVSKELNAQIAEKEAEKLRKKIEDQQTYAMIQQARIPLQESLKNTAEAEIKKKCQYKQELQDQMIQQEKIKRYKYEEFLREKKMVDDIVQRIHDEDERELQNKWCKMLKTREEMDTFKKAQLVWRQKMKVELEEENRKIQEYLLSKAAATTERQLEKERKEARKTQISENIAKQIYAAESKRKEREETIIELLQEEQKEAVERRHRQEVEKELRQRLEVRESLTRQMQERMQKQREESIQDSKYKEQIIAKYAEDLKLEQLTAEKKRLKMIQLRKDIEEMMRQKRQQYAEDMQKNMVLLKQAEDEAKERQKLIEEERMAMLKEHAKNLIGFIPPGVLRSDDLSLLGPEVMESYGKKSM